LAKIGDYLQLILPDIRVGQYSPL